MSQSKEPSMEEILSSIKRIIAEDGEAQPVRRAELSVEEADVLELTQPVAEPESMEEPEPGPPATVPIATTVAPTEPPPAAASIGPSSQPATDGLLSSATADATRQALANLSRMVVRPETPSEDNTLEGLVRELLRPMLKDWLDANLPGIVQATVDREVARISGRTL